MLQCDKQHAVKIGIKVLFVSVVSDICGKAVVYIFSPFSSVTVVHMLYTFYVE